MPDSPATPTAHQLAAQFQVQIKQTVANKFSLSENELQILNDLIHGVYISQKEPNTLCCLVVSLKNGHMYIVASQITNNGLALQNFRTEELA